MNNKKTYFIFSIIGILLLLFLTQILTPKTLTPEQLQNLTAKNIGEKITISGKIQNIKYNQKSISIILENSDIEIIIITTQLLNLQKAQQVEITGNVDFFNNKIQIIADDVIE